MRTNIHKLWVLMAMLWVSMAAIAYDFAIDNELFLEITSTSDLTCKLDSVSSDYEGTLEIPESVIYKGKSLSVTAIGSNCIHECTKLKGLSIPNTITTLEAGCFSECSSLQTADISKLKSSDIPSDIFRDCTSLVGIVFPKTVNYLPINFLYGCTSLVSFEIPDWITEIKTGCFYGCINLSAIKIPEGVVYIGNNCFEKSGIHSVSLPTSLSSIGDEAFLDAQIDSPLQLPCGLKTIGDKCFYGANVPSLSIPASLESVGARCFAKTQISSIIFEEGSLVTELGYGIFSSSAVENIVLPSGLEAIGEDCFENCSNLTEILFPESMRSFAKNSLANLRLDMLNIPIGVDKISEWCFGGNFIEFSTINHLTWNATNLNKDAYAKYASLSSESSDITWAGYDLEMRSFYLGPIDTFEISNTCKFLSLGFFGRTDDLYTGPLFKYSNTRKLILSDSDVPLTLGSIYTKGSRRTYKLYTTFPSNNDCDYFNKYWMESVEELYIGREIEGNSLYIPNLKQLTIGQTSKVDIEGPLSYLEKIECTDETPAIINEDLFSTEQFIDLPVIVPDGALENYQQSAPWNKFWNIMTKSEYEAANGIDFISTDRANEEYGKYDINGNKVGSGYKGIVIVRFSDGSCKKMLNR